MHCPNPLSHPKRAVNQLQNHSPGRSWAFNCYDATAVAYEMFTLQYK